MSIKIAANLHKKNRPNPKGDGTTVRWIFGEFRSAELLGVDFADGVHDDVSVPFQSKGGDHALGLLTIHEADIQHASVPGTFPPQVSNGFAREVHAVDVGAM